MTKPENTPSHRSKWWTRIVRCVAVVVVTGVLVRLTIKDAVIGLSTVFYATPLGLLGLGSLFCGWQSYQNKKTRVRTGAWLLLSTVLGIWWFQSMWKHHTVHFEVAQDQSTVKTLFWNVARKQDLIPAANYIRMIDADIVGLVEVVGSGPRWKKFWNEQLPEYDVSILGGGMYLLTKGSSGETTPYALTKDSHCRQITVSLRNQQVTCIVVDIESAPVNSRKVPLQKLEEVMNAHRDQPLIVMGDFNTPVDSVYLCSMRERYQLMFEEVGNGYAATWPVVFPVLTLDQIWVNQYVEPVLCQHGVSFASDHRPVIATMRIHSESSLNQQPDQSE